MQINNKLIGWRNSCIATERSSSYELLRIIASAGVIILHYNVKGISGINSSGGDYGLNLFVLQLLEVVFSCSVDIFVMLFGFFSHESQKVDLKKPAYLVLQLAVYKLVMELIAVIRGKASFTLEGIYLLCVPGEWFIVLYCALYVISPYVNACLSRLSDKNFKTLIVVLITTFSVWDFVTEIVEYNIGITVLNSTAGGEGYTIVNFVVCYIIGAAINRGVIRFKRPAVVFVVCIAMGVLVSHISELNMAVSYSSPFVIGQAASLIMLGQKITFKNPVVNLLAKAPISVYILNLSLFRLFDVESNAQQPLFFMLAHMARVIVFIYAVSLAAQMVYTWVVNILLSKQLNKLKSIQISA